MTPINQSSDKINNQTVYGQNAAVAAKSFQSSELQQNQKVIENNSVSSDTQSLQQVSYDKRVADSPSHAKSIMSGIGASAVGNQHTIHEEEELNSEESRRPHKSIDVAGLVSIEKFEDYVDD